MAEKDAITVLEENLIEKIAELGQAIDGKFNRLKEAIIGYIDLGSEMAKGSVRETLKAI